ncbi:site-specific DNA-methyltransferase [Flavobacterium sp. ST-75]|uniref:site-specific DNA-methyltransferase (cytosine-N(4)-specific) n=1 Tax=Flavobacterium rhizophilum TaxID=3163296 RepID=A0ABW8YBI0_9FLAO
MNKELTVLSEISDFQNTPPSEANNYTHAIHPYPAKFIPQIPKKIIEEFSNERHTILDPFSGSGTTLLEAKIKGRDSVGFDINPIGVLISRVKSHCYTSDQFKQIEEILAVIARRENETNTSKLWIPKIPRIEHWFKKEVIQALSIIVDEIRKIKDIDIQRFFNLCLSGIIVSVSNQESETRFAAKSNNSNFKGVFASFKRKVIVNKEKLEELCGNEKFSRSSCLIYLEDSRNISESLPENSIDLVITSPPYVNSFDYYLYHKFRIYWISYPENNEVIDITEVQQKELGSRYKFSGKNAPDIKIFKKEMVDCFKSVHKVTKPGKMIFIIVGDSIIKGEFIKMDDFYKEVCQESGMKFIGLTSYKMKNASRSFISQNTSSKHFEQKQTHVLVFQNGSKIKRDESDIISQNDSDTVYTEVSEIPLDIENQSSIIIKSNNVTNYTHGLIKYPAKYIPHIPRWAILKYSQEGDMILDNFMGSGTTNLEATILNRKSIGFDINPVAVLTSRVKTTPIPVIRLNSELESILEKLKSINLDSHDIIDFPLKEFWFGVKELEDFFKIKKAIKYVKDDEVKDFFQLTLYSIIKKISFLDESQLKVKRDHQKLLNGNKNAQELFKAQAIKNIKSMSSYMRIIEEKKLKPQTQFFLTSSTETVTNIIGNVNLIVSSPPYINAMNYPMVHRYELLLSGLISPEDYISHQTEYIGTERVYANQYNVLQLFRMPGNDFTELNLKISNIFEKEKKRAYIVKAYFEDMKNTIQKAYDYLKKGGVYVIVCGTNQIKGEFIDTCSILGEIGVELGFKKELEFKYKIQKHRFKITRHSTGKKIDEDKIIVLRK